MNSSDIRLVKVSKKSIFDIAEYISNGKILKQKLLIQLLWTNI